MSFTWYDANLAYHGPLSTGQYYSVPYGTVDK
jgi:hypothetical protein